MTQRIALSVVFGIAVLILLSGCVSSPTVIANGAPEFTVRSYQTFGYFDPLDTDRGGTQSLMSQHLIHATQLELEARGLRRDDRNPQLILNFWTAIGAKPPSSQPRVGVSVGHGTGGYYGTRGGVGLSLSTVLGSYSETQTIGVDFVDADRMQVVFEGSYGASVSVDDHNAMLDMVGLAVSQVFAQLP